MSTSLYVPLAVALVIAAAGLVVWVVLFRPLFALRQHLSFKMREEMLLPASQRTSTSLTTLASAALVLTFTVLQAFGYRNISFRWYLVGSWGGFILAVVCGIAAAVLAYVARLQNAVTVQIASKSPTDANAAITSLDELVSLQQWLFLFLYTQCVCFLGGMVFLSVFVVYNISGGVSERQSGATVEGYSTFVEKQKVVSQADLSKLDARVEFTRYGLLQADVYNGTSRALVAVTIQLTVLNQDNTIALTRLLKLVTRTGGLPLQSSRFEVDPGIHLEPGQTWQSRIVGADYE